MESVDRYRGSLLGLATGDALGTTLEFRKPGSFRPVATMEGGGPFGLAAGQWTDDTSMALCLAESLVECGFDPTDQMRRYVRWWRDGYLSSTGVCFDIGTTTRAALARFEQTGDPFSGSTGDYSAGNGSLMRLAPVPLYYSGDVDRVVHYSGESSRTTHASPAAMDACRLYGALIEAALQGAGKSEIAEEASRVGEQCSLVPSVAEVAAGSFLAKNPPGIRGTGYVVEALEAALWAFYHSQSFEEGALKAVNLGDDADTTGAILGQLAGAYYGASGIPQSWLSMLAMKDYIESLADGLANQK